MKKAVATFILLAPIMVFSAPYDVLCASLQEQMQQAEKALESKDYIAAIEQLESIIEIEMTIENQAKSNFLMGRALYERAFSLIDASRENGKVKMMDISAPQVAELKKAAEYFLAVIEIDPEGELTLEAYFMLGKVWDYDCLQKFKKAQNSYQFVVDASPKSERGVEAKECVERIDGYFQGHGKSH